MTTPNAAAAVAPCLVKRPDLIVFAQAFGGRTYLGIKDPLALRYYHLRPEEYFVLQQLDGRTSAEQIQAAFEREFALRSWAFASCTVSARCCTARGWSWRTRPAKAICCFNSDRRRVEGSGSIASATCWPCGFAASIRSRC